MKLLDELDQMSESVQSGEIQGFATWPKTGEALLEEIKVEENRGKTFLQFVLKKSPEGVKSFGVRIPTPEDKPAAKYMGMQRIYKTLFAVTGTNVSAKVSEAFAVAQKKCRGIRVRYELEEYESVSSRTGQIYTNQSLSSLQHITNELDEVFG